MKKINLKKLSVVAILCAIAYVSVFLFKFKVSFLTFDLKDAVLAVTAFLYGPIYAVCSAAIVSFLEFLTVSDTGVYGLIMNFLSSAVFALCCGLLYKFKRSLGGAILATITAVFAMTAIMLVANLFVTPFYMGVSRSEVVKLIPSLLLPFNIIKGVFNASVTMLIYKPITTALRKAKILEGNSAKINTSKTTLLSAISAILILISLFVIFVLLNGSFSFFK